jgi:hypothetical protein
MVKKRSDYSPEKLDYVRSTCLYIATILGDFSEDFVIIGGLVPSLLIDQNSLPPGIPAHLGTTDLDIGLSLAIMNEKHYEELADRIRRNGFVPITNSDGNLIKQTWKKENTAPIDFLLCPSDKDKKDRILRNIQKDFAGILNRALPLAFKDKVRITLDGTTIDGVKGQRDIYVCGPGAFVVLKALSFKGRGEGKDYYDLCYITQHIGEEEVAERLRPLLDSSLTQEAIDILRSDFATQNGIGPYQVAAFLTNDYDEDIQADVFGSVSKLLRLIEK